jgi:hypothetical protein
MAIVSRDYFYVHEWGLCRCTGTDSQGFGIHTGREAVNIESNFLEICDRWAPAFNVLAVGYAPDDSDWSIDWIGNIGAYNPAHPNPDSEHRTGRAVDLSHIRFTNGNRFDSNWSWRPERPLIHRRRYVAVAAHLRWFFSDVFTGWYNQAHENHIHIDNAPGAQPIRTFERSDTTLIQAAANVLNGAGIAVDGAWGPITEAAYKDLVHKLGLGGTSPRESVADARDLLMQIARRGFKNQAA